MVDQRPAPGVSGYMRGSEFFQPLLPGAVGAGDDLQEVSVRVLEVHTMATVVVVDWASSGLTDIHHQGHSPGKDVQNGDYGTEEAPSSSVVHPGVQG